MKKDRSSVHLSQVTSDESSKVYDILARSISAGEYENVLLNATGLPVQLVPGGKADWTFPLQGKGNPFCSLMAQFSGSCAACRQTHAELQRQVTNSLAPQVVACFAGLMEFAVPIVVSGRHVATLLGGQIFLRNPTQAQFARLAERLRERRHQGFATRPHRSQLPPLTMRCSGPACGSPRTPAPDVRAFHES